MLLLYGIKYLCHFFCDFKVLTCVVGGFITESA